MCAAYSTSHSYALLNFLPLEKRLYLRITHRISRSLMYFNTLRNSDGNSNIRFRTPKCLKRYTEVKEWDNGYIVVMADYEGMGETEEYIDLLPILKNLYINPETFLKPIKTVKIDYYEGRRN